MALKGRLRFYFITALLISEVLTTPITCRAGQCRTGEETFVTCNFHRNINDTKPGINVVWYPLLSSNTSEEKNVLKCVWPDSKEKPRCIVDDGYTFDYLISDHLTLKIPAATDDVAGLYTCYVIPPGDFYPHACGLTVTAATSPESEQATTPGSDCTGPRKESDGKAIPTLLPESEQPTTPCSECAEPCKEPGNCVREILTAAIVAFLLTTIMAFAVYFIFIKRRKICSSQEIDSKNFTEEGNQECFLTVTTPLMSKARFLQESDIGPTWKDAYIQTHIGTDSHDVQTDFSSCSKFEKRPEKRPEKEPEPPSFSRHNNLPLPTGLRKRGSWYLNLPSDNHSLDRKKQTASKICRSEEVGVQSPCVQVTASTHTAEAVSRADAAVQTNHELHKTVEAKREESKIDYLKPNNGSTTSDETIKNHSSSSNNLDTLKRSTPETKRNLLGLPTQPPNNLRHQQLGSEIEYIYLPVYDIEDNGT